MNPKCVVITGKQYEVCIYEDLSKNVNFDWKKEIK